MFYFYKFDFESLLLLEIFIVKSTLIVDMHLLGAWVKDVELHLGQAAIIGASRAIEQKNFISVTCTYCLIQIILNVNLSTEIRSYLKSRKRRESYAEDKNITSKYPGIRGTAEQGLVLSKAYWL